MESSTTSSLIKTRLGGTTVYFPTPSSYENHEKNHIHIEDGDEEITNVTADVENNSSTVFSTREVEHNKTSSSLPFSSASSLVILSPQSAYENNNNYNKNHLVSAVDRNGCVDHRESVILEPELNSHVVKIQLSQKETIKETETKVHDLNNLTNSVNNLSSKVSFISIGSSAAVIDQQPTSLTTITPLNGQSKSVIKIGENIDEINFVHKSKTLINEDMVQKNSSQNELDVNHPAYYYYMMTSGQCSPHSDTLDSGTGSDFEVTPPPLPKKMSPTSKYLHVSATSHHHLHGTGKSSENDDDEEQLSIIKNGDSKKNKTSTAINGHLSDSDESQLSLSCDSLNGSDIIGNNNDQITLSPSPPIPPPPSHRDEVDNAASNHQEIRSGLPVSLLQDIRDRSQKFSMNERHDIKGTIEICSYESRRVCGGSGSGGGDDDSHHMKSSPDSPSFYENDKFYKFHINENVNDPSMDFPVKIDMDESFAGYKDIKSGTSTIRSSKGTIRGVKNRVRNGIATFLQMQNTSIKNYIEKDAGKVVLYTTSMGILRETYAKCVNMKQILRTNLIKFEERDVFMSSEYQMEIKERMQSDKIIVPQLFVDGHHIGDADCVERLNETGELRRMLKPYKALDPLYTCQMCGGYRLLPCPSCNGSKKSVHRNHFTAEFIALKCMNCDEVGLVKCYNC